MEASDRALHGRVESSRSMRAASPHSPIARFFLSVAAAVLILPAHPAFAGSKEAEKADRLMREVAGQVTHGWDQFTEQEMVDRYRSGERLYVACGDVSLLGKRILGAAGIKSRLVATLTKEEFNYQDDGHVLLEVRVDKGWVVYDLANNLQPIDRRGRGIRISDFVADRKRRVRELTSPALDPRYDLSRATDPALTQWVFENLDLWYDRVLGIPLIMHRGVFTFHARGQRERVAAYAPSHRYVGRQLWQRIAGSPNGSAVRSRPT